MAAARFARSSRGRLGSKKAQPARHEVESLERRALLSALPGYAPIGGWGNNSAHPAWGSAGVDLIRLVPAAYADAIKAPSLPNNQSARAISNLINNQADPANPRVDLETVDQNSLS